MSLLNQYSAPLALYIEQIIAHKPTFSPSPQPSVSIYPPLPPNDPLFDSFHSAPKLTNYRTNRILTYCGAFNPPHRGHLHLLKHVFTRGTPGMNVIAAIILPRSDERLAQKVKAEDGKFMLGLDERRLLWEQDVCFPPWAWVYNQPSTFTTFSEKLTKAAEKDGFSLEFIPMYGAGFGQPDNPPDPLYGCKTMILSDAARAAHFQRPSGRLRDFDGWTKWRGMHIHHDSLRRQAQAKANCALQAMETICPSEASSMLKDGDTYVKETTEAIFEKAVEDSKAIVSCRRLGSQTFRLLFVKCEDIRPRSTYNDISSTILRNVMSTKKGVRLREALDWMALSADLLWLCRSSWMGKARQRGGDCINFQQSIEELRQPQPRRTYEKPPHFDNPPSIVKILEKEKRELASELLELAQVTSQDNPPTFEDPELLENLPPINQRKLPINQKKRKFSATGLEGRGR